MEKIHDYYDSIQSLSPKESIEYKGYTLEKCNAGSEISPPDHSEVNIYNKDGIKIETVSLNAMQYIEFINLLDKIIQTDPDDMDDWLQR